MNRSETTIKRPPILGMLVDHSRFLHRKTEPKKIEYLGNHPSLNRFTSSLSSHFSSRRTSRFGSPTRRAATAPPPTKSINGNNETTNATLEPTTIGSSASSTRSRLLTSFLNLTNQTPYTYTPQGPFSLQLHTEYDASAYSLPRKEKHVAGPLVVAFLFYAKVLDPRVATGKYYPTFEDIDRASKTMTFTELLAFCWDFNIVPQLVSRGDLRYVFGQVYRSKNDKITELTFYQFEELLTRIALVSFYPLTDGDITRIGRKTMRKLREHIEGKRVRLKDVFRRFDTSGDGILSRDEFMAGLRDICGSAIKQRDLEAVYSLVDEDGGGEVEFIEFISAMNAAAPPAFANTKVEKTPEDRFTVPDGDRLRKHEASDSETEDNDEERKSQYNRQSSKNSSSSSNSKTYKKCLHDYLNPSTSEEDRGTMLFPGGRNLSPTDRVKALMQSMGRMTVANIRHIIDTRGRLTAGKMNGSIKSQDKEYNEEISNEAHTTRILRKRDGTMCDYSAPLLMTRRAASTTDYSMELTTMWEKLRTIKRTDDWRSYHSPCGVYMGRILTNANHSYRVTVRNPLPFSITIEASIERFPDAKVSFNRQPVASGMTTEIYIDVHLKRAMEVLGTVTISWREWKREVVARRKFKSKNIDRNADKYGYSYEPNEIIQDVNLGSCTVYLYAVSYDKNNYGSKQAEQKCPAKEFKMASIGETCPRNYLAPEHPVHKFSIPGADIIATSPTRKKLLSTLPRHGSARLMQKHLPTEKDSAEENILLDGSSIIDGQRKMKENQRKK
jgi:hypothetical protein